MTENKGWHQPSDSQMDTEEVKAEIIQAYQKFVEELSRKYEAPHPKYIRRIVTNFEFGESPHHTYHKCEKFTHFNYSTQKSD